MRKLLLAIYTSPELEDEVEKVLDDFTVWVDKYLGATLEYDFYVDEKISEFGKKEDDFVVAMYDPIKKRPAFSLRRAKQFLKPLVPAFSYHSAILVYKAEKKLWKKFRPSSWTFNTPLVAGTPYIEICYNTSSTQRYGLLNTLTHEILHALHRLAWWSGFRTLDTMDTYKQDNVIYPDKAPDGNRAQNIAELEPYLDRILVEPTTVRTLRIRVEKLKASVKSLFFSVFKFGPRKRLVSDIMEYTQLPKDVVSIAVDSAVLGLSNMGFSTLQEFVFLVAQKIPTEPHGLLTFLCGKYDVPPLIQFYSLWKYLK